MARYTVSRKNGVVVSENHRTPLGAIRRARKLCLDNGQLTVSEFANHATRTGHPVAYIGFDGEFDGRRQPLSFWRNGSPILVGDKQENA